jgi:hypothetical protein
MAKAKKKENEDVVNVVQMGGNIRGLHDEIKSSYDKIEQWKKERKAINDQIKAEREKMEARGITKLAFDAAMSYVNLDQEKREGFDTAYLIAREGLGQPVKGAQADLFGEATTDEQQEGETDGEE